MGGDDNDNSSREEGAPIVTSMSPTTVVAVAIPTTAPGRGCDGGADADAESECITHVRGRGISIYTHSIIDCEDPINGRTHYAPGPKEANQGPKPRPMPDLKLNAYNAPDQQRRAIWALPLGP